MNKQLSSCKRGRQELQPRGAFDPLDLHFWPTDQGTIVFSPWLWLGRNYNISDKDFGEKLRQRMQKTLAYRTIKNPMKVLIFWIVLCSLLMFVFNNYSVVFIFSIGAFIISLIVIRIILCIQMYFLDLNIPNSEIYLDHKKFIVRKVELLGPKLYLDSSWSSALGTLIYILLALKSFENLGAAIGISIIICAGSIFRLYSARVYWISRIPNQELGGVSSELQLTRPDVQPSMSGPLTDRFSE